MHEKIVLISVLGMVGGR